LFIEFWDIFIYGFFFLKMAKYNEQQCNNKAYISKACASYAFHKAHWLFTLGEACSMYNRKNNARLFTSNKKMAHFKKNATSMCVSLFQLKLQT